VLIPLKIEIAPQDQEIFVPVVDPIEQIGSKYSQRWQTVFTVLDSTSMCITTCTMYATQVAKPLEHSVMRVGIQEYGPIEQSDESYLLELRDELNRILGETNTQSIVDREG
jgi:hypothetical protein